MMVQAVLAPSVALLAIVGIILRPFGSREYMWALAGAIVVTAIGVVTPGEALAAVGKGGDVYLFLVGMMLLSELARQQGVFDYLAAVAAQQARGSSWRLFGIVYAVGTVVTVFLSNDATAVVLTPAVYAVVRATKARPLPYLYACAFIANAASFVLPISNPANLVVYGDHMPGLGAWLMHLALPSLVSILVTLGMLALSQRGDLAAPLAEAPPMRLSFGGRIALASIVVTALVLVVASTLRWPLGLSTFIAAIIATLVVIVPARQNPAQLLMGIAWSVLPLVAGLFVLVAGLGKTGSLDALAGVLGHWAGQAAAPAAMGAGIAVGLASNVINNLPMGLVAATTVKHIAAPPIVTEGLLIGVDLGPNLSVTGSLATILWLMALRREGLSVSGPTFLRVGALVMPLALVLTLLALVLEPR